MIPDPLERMEARIDALAFEAAYDLATDTMLCCGCQRRVKVDELQSANAAPDSPSYCSTCLPIPDWDNAADNDIGTVS